MALTVAQLTARLTADTSNFFKAMSIADAAMFRTGGIAKRVGAGIGVAFVGGSVMAVRAAGNFEESMNVLQEVSGATNSEFQALGKEAKALGADVRIPNVSAKDAADAMLELAKAGLSVEDTLKGARGVLQLGVSSNLDFADSATVVARAMTAFGLKGNKATQVADLLTAAANKSTAEVGDMALGFQMAGTSFAGSNQSIVDMTASLALMANAGIAGSDAGTSLKQMMRRLTPQSKQAKDEMKKLGVEVFNAQGEFRPMREIIGEFTRATKNMTTEQRQAALGVIFGSDAIRAANVMLTKGTEKFDKMTESVTQGGEAQAMAEAKTKGFNGAVGGLISQIETLAIELGEKMLPAATEVVRGISDFVANLDPDAIVAFFKPLTLLVTGLKNLASVLFSLPKPVLAAAAAFGVFKYAILPLTSKIGKATTALKTFSVTAAFASNPVGIVVGAIAGLTLGMKMLTDASRDARIGIDELNEGFSNSVDATVAYEEAIDASKEATTAENIAKRNLNKVLQEADKVRQQEASGAITSAQAQARLNDLDKKAEPLRKAVTQATRNRRSAEANLDSTQQNANKTQEEAIRQARESARQAKLGLAWGVDVKKNKEQLSRATATLARLTGEEAIALDNANESAGVASGTFESNLNPAIKDLAAKLKGADGSKLRSELESIVSKAETTATQLKNSGPTIGSGFLGGIKSGILGGASALYATVALVVKGAVAQAKASAKIKSPSQVAAEEIGHPFTEGIAVGIADGSTSVSQAVASTMSKAAIRGTGAAKSAGNKIIQGYKASTIRNLILTNEAIDKKMKEGLRKAITNARATVTAQGSKLQVAFGRMRDRILRGFDAISSLPTALERQLQGETAAERQLRELEEGRTAASQAERKAEADNTLAAIAGRIAAANSLQQGENETAEELAARKAEELTRIEADRVEAQRVLGDIAYEQTRAALEKQAEIERANLESAAELERKNWDERRLIQREALEDQLTALENNLMSGKIKSGNIQREILKTIRSFDKGYKKSGELLGINFAAGLVATRNKVVAKAKLIAKAIENVLKLRSPAKEGPLSDLNTWWTPFSETLLEGVDTRPLSATVNGAVTPSPGALMGRGASGAGAIVVNVSDQTFAGMSREQADRVARDIKAAFDRQVVATF